MKDHIHILELSTPDMDDGHSDIKCAICFEQFSTDDILDQRRKLELALIEYQRYNKIHNDHEAKLYDIGEVALGYGIYADGTMIPDEISPTVIDDSSAAKE